MEKTKVLVVDDSALVRSLLASIVNAQSEMVCIGAASDPDVAREMIRDLNPDVLTLDVEMPRAHAATRHRKTGRHRCIDGEH